MRTLLVLFLLGGACTGTTPATPPPVGAGSQPVRRGPQAAPIPISKDDDGPPDGVKAPGNLPVRTESELRAQSDALGACLDACSETDAACRSTCLRAHPIEQVEVVPDGPLSPPPE